MGTLTGVRRVMRNGLRFGEPPPLGYILISLGGQTTMEKQGLRYLNPLISLEKISSLGMNRNQRFVLTVTFLKRM